MRLFLAILVGKLISLLTRSLNIGGGSAAPGLYALKFDPHLIEKLSKKTTYANVLITGTNGKTTTARLLAHFAKAHGWKVIRNHTGSNLERGIASSLIAHYDLFGYFKKKNLKEQGIAIWEADEAAFNSLATKINPEVIVFLNTFRDQLDRYGEVDSVVKKWRQTLKDLEKNDPSASLTVIFANGDDINTAKLKNDFKGEVSLFGIENHKIRGEGNTLQYSPKLDIEAKKIKFHGLNGSSFKIKVYEQEENINLPLPGAYNVYNFIAAAAVGACFEFKLNIIKNSLKSFSSAFGRAEKLPFGYIFLIKNPEGATQVFQTIDPQIKKNDRLLLALNDNLADGTDVSWIWDAEFESLRGPKTRGNLFNEKIASSMTPRNDVICSGTRAADLAVRLKYAGFKASQITVEPSLESALEAGRAGLQGSLYILPTYTAMLAIQGILAKMGLKGEYWRET